MLVLLVEIMFVVGSTTAGYNYQAPSSSLGVSSTQANQYSSYSNPGYVSSSASAHTSGNRVYNPGNAGYTFTAGSTYSSAGAAYNYDTRNAGYTAVNAAYSQGNLAHNPAVSAYSPAVTTYSPAASAAYSSGSAVYTPSLPTNLAPSVGYANPAYSTNQASSISSPHQHVYYHQAPANTVTYSVTQNVNNVSPQHQAPSAPVASSYQTSNYANDGNYNHGSSGSHSQDSSSFSSSGSSTSGAIISTQSVAEESSGSAIGHTYSSGYLSQSASAAPVITKHIYFHVPPPEIEERRPAQAIPSVPKKTYNIVFIKVPSIESTRGLNIQGLAARQQLPIEDKTLIYVLVRKPEQQQVVVPSSPVNSQHEVFYVKYKGDVSDVANQINNQVQQQSALQSAPAPASTVLVPSAPAPASSVLVSSASAPASSALVPSAPAPATTVLLPSGGTGSSQPAPASFDLHQTSSFLQPGLVNGHL